MKKNYFFQTLVIFLFAVSTVAAQDYVTLLKENLMQTRTADGLTEQDLEDLTIYDQSTSKKSGVEHVYATQKYNGIEIFNANVAAAFRGEALIHVGDNLQLGIAERINSASAVLSPVQAASAAASLLGAGASNFSVLETVSPQQVVLNKGGVSYDNVPVKLVYQLTDNNDFKLAWDLSIHMTNQPHWYSVRVDAVSGEIISQHDWIVSCNFDIHKHEAVENKTKKFREETFGFKEEIANTALAGEQYNIYPMPLESPDHGERSMVTEPQTSASPFGWHDTNGADGAEFTNTRGNNVWAQEDVNGNNGVGNQTDGGSELVFDFPLDITLDAPAFTDAATTNLFYWNNIVHDVMYEYGFDEVSGNFQENNYENGGSGSDYVFADSQDGSRLDNATFGTPPEGNNPRMTMFLWNTTGEPGILEVTEPADLAGDIGLTVSTFSSLFPSIELTPLMGDLALVEDVDASGDPLDACDAIANAGDINGKIAVIRRGTCTFVIKVEAAEAAGAIGVIIVNNVADAPINLGIGADDETTASIPAGMVNQADGDLLIAALQNGETISVNATRPILVDGSFDNGIIVHEYGHGISNRLTGGPSITNCLQNAEQMGEGWSDYYGLMLTMTANDTAEQARGIGNFATAQPVDGAGIRPRPYSTDFAVNEFTYGVLTQYVNDLSPHRTGHLWTTMIWDMTWILIDQFGFDADLYNGTGGNNIALQLVTDGLKLQPCNPGFVTGRDGILAAVDINTMIPDDEKDFVKCSIWGAFANRGLGLSADQGSPFSRGDGQEAFDTPSTTDETSPCFDVLSADEFAENNFSIFPNPSNGQININMATNLGEGHVKIMDLNGRIVFAQDLMLEGILNINASGVAKGVYIVQVANQTVSETAKLIIR